MSGQQTEEVEFLRNEVVKLRAELASSAAAVLSKETAMMAALADARAVETRSTEVFELLRQELSVLRLERSVLRTELSAQHATLQQLREMEATISWRLATRLQVTRHRLAPSGSRRASLWVWLIRTHGNVSRSKNTQAMRIVIAGPPKCGNTWLKCLLSTVYNLRWLRDVEIPKGMDPGSFQAFVERGAFHPGTIFHQHFRVSDDFLRLAALVPCHVVTIIRNPYDLFVSLYYHVQTFRRDLSADQPRAMMVDKSIDHPDVLYFLEHHFREVLVMANDWLHSQGSIIVRYEDLVENPEGELATITNRIRLVEHQILKKAVDRCNPENMRKMGEGMSKHVRTATIGDWKNHLNEEHIRIFRSCHGDLITSLGYNVL